MKTPQMALRFLYFCRRRCFFIMSYRADDPISHFLVRRKELEKQ